MRSIYCNSAVLPSDTFVFLPISQARLLCAKQSRVPVTPSSHAQRSDRTCRGAGLLPVTLVVWYVRPLRAVFLRQRATHANLADNKRRHGSHVNSPKQTLRRSCCRSLASAHHSLASARRILALALIPAVPRSANEVPMRDGVPRSQWYRRSHMRRAGGPHSASPVVETLVLSAL